MLVEGSYDRMRSMRRKHHRNILLMACAWLVMAGAADAANMARVSTDGKWAMVPLADGFDYPVGKPNGEGYYKSRGVRLQIPRHMGEDWNGKSGGNSDKGDPVYTVGTGLVTYASDARGRWGKVVIVRHAFREPRTGKVLCCQTLYGHLDRIDVKLGQIVKRGEQVGTIGTNRGMYPAHLHAELHFNVLVNCGQQGIPKTSRNYGHLTNFIQHYRRLRPENKEVRLPIGCFLPYKDTEGL